MSFHKRTKEILATLSTNHIYTDVEGQKRLYVSTCALPVKNTTFYTKGGTWNINDKNYSSSLCIGLYIQNFGHFMRLVICFFVYETVFCFEEFETLSL